MSRLAEQILATETEAERLVSEAERKGVLARQEAERQARSVLESALKRAEAEIEAYRREQDGVRSRQEAQIRAESGLKKKAVQDIPDSLRDHLVTIVMERALRS